MTLLDLLEGGLVTERELVLLSDAILHVRIPTMPPDRLGPAHLCRVHHICGDISCANEVLVMRKRIDALPLVRFRLEQLSGN